MAAIDSIISNLNPNPSLDGTEEKAIEKGGANYKQSLTEEKIFILEGVKSNVYESNDITFTNVTGDYFGKFDTPLSGALTINVTGAVTGAISVINYNDATLTLPFTPKIETGTFAPNILNKIYIERDVDGYYYVNITNEPNVVVLPDIPTNIILTEL